MSDPPEGSSNRGRNKSSRGRRPSIPPETLHRPLLASPGSVDVDDVERQRSMRRRIAQDLPRMNRSFDPNRIELEVPPEFLSPQLSADKGKAAEGEMRDTREDMKPRPQGSSVELSHELSRNPTNETTQNLPVRPDEATDSDTLSLVPSNPITVLGAGRTDPFANYPIKMNAGELRLIDQVNTGQDPTFRTFRERWLPVAVRDAATFHQFLANVSLNISRVRGEDLNSVVSVAHHSIAIRSVNEKLSDPMLRTSDDVIISILSFVCFSTVKEDFHNVSIHLDGLKNVIRLRGGFEAIENDPVLGNLLFGVDMTRSLRQDTQPLFPISEQIKQKLQTDKDSDDPTLFAQALSSGPWRQIFPPGHAMISIFDEMEYVIRVIGFKRSTNQEWRIAHFAIVRMYPIVHRLLNLGLDPDPNDQWSIVQEASRLGILLFLGEIRRRCGVLGVSTKLYVIKLKVYMAGLGSTIDWTSANLLLLWIMFFGLLESWKMPEQNWYVESVHAVMARTTLRTWDSVVEKVKSFLWVDDIYDEKIEIFRSIVSTGSLEATF